MASERRSVGREVGGGGAVRVAEERVGHGDLDAESAATESSSGPPAVITSAEALSAQAHHTEACDTLDSVETHSHNHSTHSTGLAHPVAKPFSRSH